MNKILIIYLIFLSDVQGACHAGITTTKNLTSTTPSSTPQITSTTELTSTSTVFTTTTEEMTSSTTIPSTTTELSTTTTTTEIPTTTTEKNLCPHGFYDRCKQTCGCLDLSADTERLNKIYNKFSDEYPETYVNATLKWSECLRVDMVSCSEGSPVVFLFDTNTGTFYDDSDWNTYSNSMIYTCEGGNWIIKRLGDAGYEIYFSCKLL